MSITELSVKRPSAVFVLLALFIGIGIFGYKSLGADLYPSINVPIITVTTVYNGAGAEEIEEDVVKPIEDAVSGISGIDTLKSISKEGIGQTIITFTMETDMNSAFLDVQKAVDGASGKLPEDVNSPILRKIDADAQSVLTLGLTGTIPYYQLQNEAEKIKEDLAKIPGIGQVSLQGAEDKQLAIRLDKTAMDYYRINVNSLLTKLKTENSNLPAGRISLDTSDQAVKVVGQFKDIDEIKNLLIPNSEGGTVRLADIAQIQLEYPDQEQILTLNGTNALGISIQKQSDANVVEAVNNVKAELLKIQAQLPAGVSVTVTTDSTTFINDSLEDVKSSLVEGVITTALVLLLFLRSWQSSLVVLVAIPTSLVSTFFMMYAFDFTLNMMTLMALSLSIGILVDDSIVVLENIQRHLGMGKNPKQAAIQGRREIGMAAIAITLCDVVIFIPVAFMSGMVGQFFKEFGLTVAVASLFSLLVSFTVTPMLASLFLKKKNPEEAGELQPETKKPRRFPPVLDRATELYKKLLIWSLDHRWKVVSLLIAGCILAVSLLPLGFIKTEFTPQSDQSQISIELNLTSGSGLKQTEDKVSLVENQLQTMAEVKDYLTTVGYNSDKSSANIIVKLVDKSERQKSQTEIATEMRQWGNTLPGVQFSVSESQSAGGNGKPVQLVISGEDPAVLKELSYKVEDIVKATPGTADVTNSERTSESEIQVKVDRLAAVQYGVNTPDISTVLRTGLQGSKAGIYRQNGNEYDIVLRFMDNQIKTPADLGAVKVQNSAGEQIALNQVAAIEYAESPLKLSREDRENIVTISANLQNSLLGDVTKLIENQLEGFSLPDGYTIEFGGSQENMAESFSALIQALIVAIVLVYAILIILYESFLTPFIRMLSLPCAIIGAFGLLALSGESLNILSMIGLILLDGLASKNGTLLIDYTQTLMKQGMPLREALIESGTTRLRPILMTSATMIVGMLPSALSSGAGSEMRSGMAIIIIGGMITSTVLSPIVLPVVYTMMDDARQYLAKRKKPILTIREVEDYEAY
ncbi:efflux RND transporter permease subunit [Desulfosporosinus meridiei]|uniref:Cation/multidrug efflux pump n=1 Tax=Desulfosporosinus meridiei (strain ATCC BAA-275 / DSM 13257 / KCTC 12902 / NCIMB 13706 / S10) TaxID=768704 RepID=J7IWA9_DESMD|nr:efflux RND transporter permease subunit [Desulfosporosinus meridiei]AFQ43388.1 cation/multidrug efflux pump [Desulfosporosinus meridiei DSM 13257]